MQNLKQNFLFLLLFFGSYAQVFELQKPPDHIKSIEFRSENSSEPFPILQFNEVAVLSFDDLNADEADYYYTLQHYTHDWKKSDLFESEYIEGFDNLRIRTYKNSFNTLQPYSHYQLRIPNEQTQLKLSGNYALSIYDNSDRLVFNRRFVIYEDTASVGVEVVRSRDLEYIESSQSVQFSINTQELLVRNPSEEIKPIILQNYIWDSAISNLSPQFTLGSVLHYKYDKETRFEGGNEYLYFDTKDIRISSGNVYGVQLKDLYNTYLYSNEVRAGRPYSYAPDINGDFVIRTLQGTDSTIEADYSIVHFSLRTEPLAASAEVFVVGGFNDHQLDDRHQLFYNELLRQYEGSALLKQGFYNYHFEYLEAGKTLYPNLIGGSHWDTENQYIVLVYLKKFGQRHDSLLGVGSGSSLNIRN